MALTPYDGPIVPMGQAPAAPEKPPAPGLQPYDGEVLPPKDTLHGLAKGVEAAGLEGKYLGEQIHATPGQAVLGAADAASMAGAVNPAILGPLAVKAIREKGLTPAAAKQVWSQVSPLLKATPITDAARKVAPGLVDYTNPEAQAQADQTRAQITEARKESAVNRPRGGLAGFGYDVATMAPQLAVAAAAGRVNPALGAATFGVPMAGGALAEGVDRGLPVEQAAKRATVATAPAFALGAPMEALLSQPLKNLAESKLLPEVIKRIASTPAARAATGLTATGLTMGLSQGLTDAYDAGVLGDNISLGEALKRAGHAGLVAAVAAAPGAAVRLAADVRGAPKGGDAFDEVFSNFKAQQDGTYRAPNGANMGSAEQARAAWNKAGPEERAAWMTPEEATAEPRQPPALESPDTVDRRFLGKATQGIETGQMPADHVTMETPEQAPTAAGIEVGHITPEHVDMTGQAPAPESPRITELRTLASQAQTPEARKILLGEIKAEEKRTQQAQAQARKRAANDAAAEDLRRLASNTADPALRKQLAARADKMTEAVPAAGIEVGELPAEQINMAGGIENHAPAEPASAAGIEVGEIPAEQIDMAGGNTERTPADNAPPAAPEPAAPESRKPVKPEPKKTGPTAAEIGEQGRLAVLRIVKNAGGLGMDNAADITGERGRNAVRRAPGLFRKNGRGIDEIATSLHEAGYISDRDYADVDGGAEKAREIIADAINKQPVVSMDYIDEYTRLKHDESMSAQDAIQEAGIGHDQVNDLINVGLDAGSKADVLDYDLLSRIDEADPAAFERAAKQYENDDTGLMDWALEWVNERAAAAVAEQGTETDRRSPSDFGAPEEGTAAGESGQRRPDGGQARGEGQALALSSPEPRPEPPPARKSPQTADMFGRNESAQAIADRQRAQDARRNGTQDVSADTGGGLFSAQTRQRDIADAAPDKTPEAGVSDKFNPGDIVNARPHRTIDEAKVVRTYTREVAGAPMRLVEVEKPDGKRIDLTESELSPGKFGGVNQSASAESDRNTFTLERKGDDGHMAPVRFERGETVKISGSYPMHTGVIAGISHANRQFRLEGSQTWHDFGFAYKQGYDEFAKIRKGIEDTLNNVEQRLDKGNSIGAQDMIRDAAETIQKHDLSGYDDRLSTLRSRAHEVAAATQAEIKANDEARAKAEQAKRDEETKRAKPAEPIKMTMDEWKAVHPSAKGTTHGVRTVLREGGLVPVQIVRAEKAAPAAESKFEQADKTIDALRDGSAKVDQYRAAFAAIADHPDAVKAELNAKTKDQLYAMVGGRSAVRDMKKPELVSAVYKGMLDAFALGKQYGPNSYVLSADGMAKHQAEKREALKALVEGQTQNDLDEYAAEIEKRRAEFAASRARRLEGLKNPETLDQFRDAMRAQMHEGKTLREARLTLSEEQRAKFDKLAAEKTRAARADQKEAQHAVRVAGQTVDANIVETKHTKKGHDLFVVRLAERVSTDDYKTLNAGAKKLGGYYSSYRGNGAVPGFTFTDRDAAEAFVKLANGDATAANEAAQSRRDVFEDDRSQTAVERLTAMADRLEQRADESLSQDRKQNTERRARMAASAEASARSDKALAQTMRNIAEAIDAGRAEFLDRVRQKAQVELLSRMLANARGDQLRAKYDSYADQLKHQGEPPDGETIEFVNFPEYTAMRSDLAVLARDLLEVDGLKALGTRLKKVADDVSAEYVKFAKENYHKVAPYSMGNGERAVFANRESAERAIKRSGLRGKAIVLPLGRGKNAIVMAPSEAIGRGIWQGDGDKRITLTDAFGDELVEKFGRLNRRGSRVSLPWQFETAHERRKALARMGLQTPAELRTAMREFLNLRTAPKPADKVKEMERAMIGRRNDGLDFFPTPESVADEMVATAGIEPGMSVLEPSAGMGHLADRIRASGVDPDVVEMSGNRRELLEAKGFNLLDARDFLELKPGANSELAAVQSELDAANAAYVEASNEQSPDRSKLRRIKEKADDLASRRDVLKAEAGIGGSYDRIVMNPPFSDGRDMTHVRHAFDLLKPGGRLVAIMGEGAFFRDNKQAREFRDWLDELGGTSEKLAEGSFMDPSLPVNTGVSARMVVIDKPADASAADARKVDEPAAMFSLPDADTIRRRMGRMVDEYLAGRVSPSDTVLLGDTPAALRASGMPAMQLEITGATLAKTLDGKHRHEGITPDIVKQIPDQLRDPLMVFQSASGDAGFVVVTEITSRLGDPVIAALHVGRRSGRLTVNRIASIYGKEGAAAVLPRWARDGLLRYVRNDESPESPTTSQRSIVGDVVQAARSSGTEYSTAKKLSNGKDSVDQRIGRIPSKASTPDELRAALDARFGAKGVSGLFDSGLVQIVQSYADLPDHVRRAIERSGPESAPQGIYYRGSKNHPPQAFIIADNTSAELVPGILLHEIGEHHGLREMLGDKGYAHILDYVRSAKGNDPEIREAWEYVLENYTRLKGDPQKAMQDAWDYVLDESPHLEEGSDEFIKEVSNRIKYHHTSMSEGSDPFVREVIARVGEKADPSKPGWFRNLINKVRQFLAKLGLIRKISAEDIRRMVVSSLRRVMDDSATSIYPGGGVDFAKPDGAARPAETNPPSGGFFDDGGVDFAFGGKPPKTDFTAENDLLREKDKTAWVKAKTFWRRNFLPGGLLPKEVFSEKIQRDNELAVAEFDTEHLVGSFDRAIKAEYGKPFEALPVNDMRKLSEALGGKVDPAIPEKTRTIILAMRQYIDRLSAEYVDILQRQAAELEAAGDPESAAQADMIRTITGNIGHYVNRSYRAFDDPKWFSRVSDPTIQAAREYLTQQALQSGETPAEAAQTAERVMNRILKSGTAYDSMGAFITESKLGAKDLSILKKRKDIAPQIRALLGEYVDPRLNFAKSVAKMSRLVWNQRFLDRVREIGMDSFLFTEDQAPPRATAKIAADTSEAYAPLNGLYTYPDVNQAFRDALGKDQIEKWYRWVVQLNGMVKYGKTVLSPTTAARNWQSALFFALGNGHFNLTHAARSIAGVREYFTHAGSAEQIAYLRKLKQLGVVYDTAYAGEMMRLLKDSKIDELLQSRSGATYKVFRNANKYATKAYQYGDDFWKIIGFENEKSALIDAGMSPAEAEAEAAERIRNTYPTYSMVGRGVNKLRRFPLAGSFVSFPAEILRTSVHMIRYVAKDWKAGRRKLAMQRAAGIAMVAGFTWALQAITKAMFGVDDDEEEAVRILAAPWQKNSNLMFIGRDGDGRLQYFDLSFLDPYNWWKKPITAILRDQPWEDAAADALKEIFVPFFGTDIVFGATIEVVSNKKSGSGQPVYSETATPIEQTEQIATHLGKALQPGVASNLERTWKAMKGQRSPSGKLYDLGDEGMGWLGWRATTLDPKQALYYRSFEFNDARAEARSTLNRVLHDPNAVSQADIRSAYADANRRYGETFRKMSLVISAAQKSGLSKLEAARMLNKSGVSPRDVVYLLNGKVPDLVVTPQSMKSAVSKANERFGPQTARDIANRYRYAASLARRP